MENVINDIRASLRKLNDAINKEPDKERAEQLKKWKKEREQEFSRLIDAWHDLEYQLVDMRSLLEDYDSEV